MVAHNPILKTGENTMSRIDQMLDPNRNDFMTVEDLINELKNMDPKSPVVFSYNYGDHPQTMVAELVKTVDEGQVRYSEYHRMLAVVPADEEEDDSGEVDESNSDKKRDVVVINLS